MDKQYLITVVTIQEADGETDTLEMTTHASFEGDSDNYIITYKEDDSEEGESTTLLKVEKGSCISVSREGAINSYMTIEAGMRHLSHHVTPYGAFSLGITGKKVESEMSDKGGTLNFKYATDQELHPIGEIEFIITMKPKKTN
ncbi:MAG: DUF1934 domain-containing protein [Clostridia bacterium]|nr:DUF1934 domain-containing protein [Clostridia bacterium]